MGSPDERLDADQLRRRVADLEQQLEGLQRALEAAEDRLWKRSPPPLTPAALVALQDREHQPPAATSLTPPQVPPSAGRPTPLVRKTEILHDIADAAPVTPPAPPGPFPPGPSAGPLVDDGRPAVELRIEIAHLRSRCRNLEQILEERARAGYIERYSPATPPRIAAPPTVGSLGDRIDADAVERFVGGRLVAWLGAVVLIAALAVFGHLAYTRGWLGFIGPTGRLIIGYLAAGLLIVAADLARRRVGRAASVGFAAAGIAGLYVTTAVGVAFNVITTPELALGAAMAAAVVGLAATLWFDGLAIAVIAVLGGYLSLVWTNGFSASPLVSAVHLTLCLAIALVPSALRHARFRPLRFIAIVFHVLVSLVWLLGPASGEPALALVFVCLWWAMVMAEAMRAAMRGQSPIGNAVAALMMTAAAASAIGPVLAETIPWTSPLAYTPLTMAAMAIAASFMLPAVDAGMCETEEERAIAHASRSFAAILRLLAILLAALGLAPFLGSAALAVTWSLVAAGLCESERRGLVVGGRIGAIVVLFGAGIAGLLAPLAGAGPVGRIPLEEWMPGLGTVMLRWEAIGLITVCAAACVIAARVSPRAFVVRGVAAGFGVLAWFALIVTSADQWSAMVLVTVAPLAFLFARRIPLPFIGLAASIGIAAIWVAFKIDTELSIGLPRTPPIGVDILVAVLLVAVASVCSMRVSGTIPRAIAQVATSVMMIAFTGIVVATYGKLAGFGQHGSDLAGLAAGSVAIVAAIMARTAIAFESRALVIACVFELIFATMLWIGATLMGGSFEWGVAFGTPFANIGTAAGIVIVVSALLVARAASTDASPSVASIRSVLVQVLIGVALAAGIATISREVARVVGLADPTIVSPVLSFLWGAFGIGFIVLGFVRRMAIFRWVGLGALGAVAVKVLAWDMRNTDTLLRVVILLSIGILLVIVSVLYAKRARDEATRRIADGRTADS